MASRRRAEELLVAGRVRVNGAVVTELSTRIHPERDRVEVDGTPVRMGPKRWILLNKPAGTLTTRRDPGRRPTVYDLLRPEDRGLTYVGRLDRDTEGLLLFTNDGDTANRLLHPSGEVEREYLADVEGHPDRRTLETLTRGIELDDGPARAARVQVTARGVQQARLKLVLTEGRKREVRRMLAAVGHPVIGLTRVRLGPQRLGALARGAWRELRSTEVRALQETAARPTKRGVGPGAGRRAGRS